MIAYSWSYQDNLISEIIANGIIAKAFSLSLETFIPEYFLVNYASVSVKSIYELEILRIKNYCENFFIYFGLLS